MVPRYDSYLSTNVSTPFSKAVLTLGAQRRYYILNWFQCEHAFSQLPTLEFWHSAHARVVTRALNWALGPRVNTFYVGSLAFYPLFHNSENVLFSLTLNIFRDWVPFVWTQHHFCAGARALVPGHQVWTLPKYSMPKLRLGACTRPCTQALSWALGPFLNTFCIGSQVLNPQFCNSEHVLGLLNVNIFSDWVPCV